MWGSKKMPAPPPVALSQRAEPAVASEPSTVQRQLRSKSTLINGMVDRLPTADRIVALCDGRPGVFGQSGGPRYGVYVLTSRELLWRNSEGQSIDVALCDVQQMQTTYVSQYCVYIELATRGGHQMELALAYSEHSSGREFYETLETTLRDVRESRIATPPAQASVADELEKLAALRERGILTDAEFESQKRALLGG
jgi:hypothetical protein